MFLSKKGVLKIVIMASAYFVLASICIALGVCFTLMGVDSALLFILGIITYALCPIIILSGRFSEGKGKLIATGNKLVRRDLKPAEFIRQYDNLRNSTELIMNKPSVEVLQLVATAYDALDDGEHCLAIADEMIAVASDKQIAYAKLVKASFLFCYGKPEEAEALFAEAQGAKMNALSNMLADAILKTDRAMVLGDYKVAETYCLKTLSRTFPKLDNLAKLAMNYQLGLIYEKTQDHKKAIFHYRYCADFGGETATRAKAQSALERLQ